MAETILEIFGYFIFLSILDISVVQLIAVSTRDGKYTDKMSPVYICQNDKPMTSLALSTAHQVKTNLCQSHSLKGCHIFVINLPKTCHPQFLFHAVDGSRVPI